jgi:hypothetical protein
MGALGLGIARVGLGLALFARPAVLPRAIGVDRVSARRLSWAVRLFAVRDAALGAGIAHAVVTHKPVRPWLAASALSDAGDVASLAAAIRGREVAPVRAGLIAAFAVGGVLGTAVAARDVDLSGD